MTKNTDKPFERMFAVLDYVASSLRAVSTTEISEELKLPLNTTHRIVANLTAQGFLRRVEDARKIVVGPALIKLMGKTAVSAFRIARRTFILEELVGEIGEQCEIGVVHNNTVIYVDSVRVAEPQALQFDPTVRAPLHCTSTGKVYLSRLPADERGRYVRAMPLNRFTEHTITDADAFLAHLEHARKTGWAKTNEEFVLGLIGCAVPILSPDNVLLACLCVSVPNARVSFEELDKFRDPLERAAKRLADDILSEK